MKGLYVFAVGVPLPTLIVALVTVEPVLVELLQHISLTLDAVAP